jgi:hypothetical protein
MYEKNTFGGLWIAGHNIPRQAAGIVIGDPHDPLALGIACGQHCQRVQIKKGNPCSSDATARPSHLQRKRFTTAHMSRGPSLRMRLYDLTRLHPVQ